MLSWSEFPDLTDFDFRSDFIIIAVVVFDFLAIIAFESIKSSHFDRWVSTDYCSKFVEFVDSAIITV